ncbi:MAG: M14 family zinc carboxypeptidase [Acidobacteriota bacterium]
MKSVILVIFVLLLQSMNTNAQTPAELASIWDKEHVSNMQPSNVRHKDLQKYLNHLKASGINIVEVGRSNANREIYQMEFGSGPLKVFLWSQMHGDEPTATSALIDIFEVFQKDRGKDWVKRIASTMTIRAVPMLNPDGAEAYVRRNLQGIDINRDAVDLKTPEARLLKRLRDEWSPDIGFNLHNQNSLTTVGDTAKQAGISFLVVYGDAAKTPSSGHERNRRLVSGMNDAIATYMPGHIGRYDDEFSPTAFGDNFSAWGTPAILIETGTINGKDEMFFVKMNFIAIVTALRSLADGSEKTFIATNYDRIPENSSGRLYNFVFRNATVAAAEPAGSTAVVDIGVNIERRRAELVSPVTVRKIGDLSGGVGLNEYDASGFMITSRDRSLKPGSTSELFFFRISRKVDLNAADPKELPQPDAVFADGKWIKGAGTVPAK